MENMLTASAASTPQSSYTPKVSKCYVWCRLLTSQDRPLCICQSFLQHCDIKVTTSCVKEWYDSWRRRLSFHNLQHIMQDPVIQMWQVDHTSVRKYLRLVFIQLGLQSSWRIIPFAFHVFRDGNKWICDEVAQVLQPGSVPLRHLNHPNQVGLLSELLIVHIPGLSEESALQAYMRPRVPEQPPLYRLNGGCQWLHPCCVPLREVWDVG